MTKKQITTWIIVVLLSWYGMMAMHEVGHCIGAIATGAKIDTVKIPLAGFSRTAFSGGTSPLVAVWSGPFLGATMPAVFLTLFGVAGPRIRQALQFFIGFCLLANGAYVGLGSFSGAGDCRDLVQYGSSVWHLIAFGIASSACGLYAWHRMGPLRTWFAQESQNRIEQNNSVKRMK